MEELFVLDCHALQARNDSWFIPLGGVAFSKLNVAKMPNGHRSVSSRSLPWQRAACENNVLL
ncbi:MAG: hypothetical protein K9G11_01955 [Rickettsiaceae bacterium]|nr:hypothetical protein [Rickettsiaceae bacterium]